MHLMIIFIHAFVYKNSFTESKVTSSGVLFCLSNSLKKKKQQNKKKQQKRLKYDFYMITICLE